MKGFSLKSLFGRGSERRRNRRSSPSPGTTILIVDDSRTVRVLLSKMLRQGEYNTLEAEDGETAITLATRHLPDMILMDVVMPGITGFQATRRLHRQVSTRHIPIIIMSGNEQAIEEFWVTRIGARDFMAKPFNRGEVYRRIEKILHNNEIL